MKENKSLPRKEREKLNRKMAILEAAIDLFALKGYHNTTLDEIATTSEFGKGTLYNYFSSKEEIIKSIIEDVMGKNLEALRVANSTSTTFIEFLNSYTKSIFQFCQSNHNAFILLAEFYIEEMKRGASGKFNEHFCLLHSEVDSILIKRIETAVKKKEIKKINAKNLHMLYHNMVFPYALEYLRRNSGTEINVDEQIRFVNDIIFNGISIR